MTKKPVVFDISHPDVKRTFGVYNYMDNESDRGKVLVIIASIDETLRQMVLAHLIDAEESQKIVGIDGALGPLVARARMCYALGFISKCEYEEIKTLAKIRNEFAHKPDCSFDEPAVVKLCSKLSTEFSSKDLKYTPAQKFWHSTQVINVTLGTRPSRIKKQKPMK
ncbi:MltR family transcriptional regulator [Ferrovibrio sp. MS7]|uniref:MltR family transcriptional regulator n=1 Tax=Ferrovibrio plantarum TaxID=3119164 RepID=UPI0031349656